MPLSKICEKQIIYVKNKKQTKKFRRQLVKQIIETNIVKNHISTKQQNKFRERSSLSWPFACLDKNVPFSKCAGLAGVVTIRSWSEDGWSASRISCFRSRLASKECPCLCSLGSEYLVFLYFEYCLYFVFNILYLPHLVLRMPPTMQRMFLFVQANLPSTGWRLSAYFSLLLYSSPCLNVLVGTAILILIANVIPSWRVCAV